jgi:hypothetical protein
MPIYGLLLAVRRMCETYLGGAFFAVRVSILNGHCCNIEFFSVYREVTGEWADLARVLLIPSAMLAYRINVDGMPGWPL